MNLKEKILFHQVYPAKLATDVLSAIVSLYFLWQHDLVTGLLTHYVPPPIASFLVIHLADFESYKNSRLGAYLMRYMTGTAQAMRLIGDLITVFAAWYHSALGITAGLVLILCAWLYGVPSFRRQG
jgi:hypothetical protein